MESNHNDIEPGADSRDEQEMGTIQEIWVFLRVRKKFWLAPIIIALVLLSLLFGLATAAGPLAPFIYPL